MRKNQGLVPVNRELCIKLNDWLCTECVESIHHIQEFRPLHSYSEEFPQLLVKLLCLRSCLPTLLLLLKFKLLLLPNLIFAKLICSNNSISSDENLRLLLLR